VSDFYHLVVIFDQIALVVAPAGRPRLTGGKPSGFFLRDRLGETVRGNLMMQTPLIVRCR
jgi:hypothetical protein